MVMEQCELPDAYAYKIINFEPKKGNNYTLSYKIKNIRTEGNVKKWLKDYEKSKFVLVLSSQQSIVWVLDVNIKPMLVPNSQEANKKLTKNTDCPTTLKIVMKRYLDAPKLKKPDEETKMFPCTIDSQTVSQFCEV